MRASTRLAEIDLRFALELPDYAAFASPTSVSVEEVQAQLGAGEAVVLFLDTPTRKPLCLRRARALGAIRPGYAPPSL